MGVVVVNFLAKNLATVTNGFNTTAAWLGVVCEFSGQFCWISNMLKNIQYADFLSGFIIERRTGKKIVVEQSLRIHKNYQAKVCNLLVRFVPLVIDHNPGYKS